MVTVDFFKQQAKKLLKDYKTRTFNEDEGYYEYHPQFFNDIDSIIMSFDIDRMCDFGLMNAQHIIAKLSGFNKWAELGDASPCALELGKLLLTHREEYQQKIGIFTNMVDSLIVDDWKNYEMNYLDGYDDESKLEVFKGVFLGENSNGKKRGSGKIIIDFQDDEDAQDMLAKIMQKKNVTADKAILSSITQKNCLRIIQTGWAGVALPLWGHAELDSQKEKLTKPIIEIKLNKAKEELIVLIAEHENVDAYVAIKYFMLFHLESLGYHI